MHPVVIYGEEVMRNEVFYRPPAVPAGAEDELEAMLRGLLEHQKVHRALAEAEQRFRNAIDLMPSPYLILDPSRRITFVNRRALQLFGRRHEDVIGQPIESAWDHPLTEAVARGLADAEELRSATPVTDSDGSASPWYVIPVYDEDNDLSMFLAFTRDGGSPGL